MPQSPGVPVEKEDAETRHDQGPIADLNQQINFSSVRIHVLLVSLCRRTSKAWRVEWRDRRSPCSQARNQVHADVDRMTHALLLVHVCWYTCGQLCPFVSCLPLKNPSCMATTIIRQYYYYFLESPRYANMSNTHTHCVFACLISSIAELCIKHTQIGVCVCVCVCVRTSGVCQTQNPKPG